MPTCEILPFATGVGANVESQDNYAADPATSAGFSAGIAPSAKLNKAWRQSSFMAAALAQWLVAQGNDVLDDGDLAGLTAKLIEDIVSTDMIAAQAGASLMGYIAAFSGAIPRTVQSRGRDSISLRDICLGDGSDESTKIATILNSGAPEVWVPEGTFIGAGITVTSGTLRRIIGPGTLKLKDAANTFLFDLTGTSELEISGPTIDGNKANQSGGTQETRSNYILINITDISTVGTQIHGVKFINAYFGAFINNSGIRTHIYGNWFYNGGMTAYDGTCDAIYNGTAGAAFAKIHHNYIHNCSDYGVACDTSGVEVFSNTISNCYAGIGSLTRGAISGHDVYYNGISGCVKPIDYFNSVSDSTPANRFSSIKIRANRVSTSTGTGSLISFSANNATLQLCENVEISGNDLTTEANNSTHIFVSSATGAGNKGVKVFGNKLIGDANSQTARYAIAVNNTDGYEQYDNTFNGVDLAVYLQNVTGNSHDNNFSVLRDCYSTIDNSNVSIREKFKAIPRRCVSPINGSVVTLDAEFDTVSNGLFVDDVGGTLPASTVYIDRLVTKGVNTDAIYIAATNNQKLVFNSQPIQISRFNSNVVQPSWNIVGPPTVGTWVQGQEWYCLSPTVGQPLGGVCTVGGTPGTWVSRANL